EVVRRRRGGRGGRPFRGGGRGSHPGDGLFLYCGRRAPPVRGRLRPNERGRGMGEQSTLLIIKPDAVRRGLIGELISRVERKGLRIEAMRMIRIEQDLAERHYDEHR